MTTPFTRRRGGRRRIPAHGFTAKSKVVPGLTDYKGIQHTPSSIQKYVEDIPPWIDPRLERDKKKLWKGTQLQQFLGEYVPETLFHIGLLKLTGGASGGWENMLTAGLPGLLGWRR